MTKIAAVCCTYKRPKQLGQMIRCFERQDYDDRELVILDDAGQYAPACGDRWRLVSTPHRFACLGDKRNAAARLISHDAKYIAVWDDDDLYLSWALSATVAALERAPLSRPSIVLHPDAQGRLHQHETGGLFHSGWGYRPKTLWIVGGYPAQNNGEDQSLLTRFVEYRVATCDPIALGFKPFLIYPWETTERPHLSGAGPRGYQNFGMFIAEKTDIRDWIVDPPFDLTNPCIVPGVKPRKF